jgi:hypothetical protein
MLRISTDKNSTRTSQDTHYIFSISELILFRMLGLTLHPEGPATGQLDQGFPWFSLVPERILSWYPNSTLHCMLLVQPSQSQTKVRPLQPLQHLLNQN